MCILFRSIFSSQPMCILRNDQNGTLTLIENDDWLITFTENDDELSKHCYFRLNNASIQNFVLPSSFNKSNIYISNSMIHGATASFKMNNDADLQVGNVIFMNANVEFILRQNGQAYFENCDLIDSTIKFVLENHSTLILMDIYIDEERNGKMYIDCIGEGNTIIHENPYDDNLSISENCHYEKRFKGFAYSKLRSMNLVF